MLTETTVPESQEYLAEEEALLQCILDMGELLLTSGAEVKRVEDTTGITEGLKYDPTWKMKLPLLIITTAIVLCGIFSNNIVEMLAAVSAGVI